MDILVHVSAPATVHHDKQHLALAQAIIDFHPAVVTRAGDYDNTETFVGSASQPEQAEKATTCLESLKVVSRGPLKRSRTVSTVNPNPPYRNPLRRGRNSINSDSDTTAPLTLTKGEPSPGLVQIPRTHSAVRRAFSDPLPSTTSKIADSQERFTPESSSGARISSPLGLKGDIVISLSQTSIDDQPPSKRARVEEPSNLSFTANNPGAPVGGKSQCLKLWSSPYLTGISEQVLPSDASTASPSQSLQGEVIWPSRFNHTPKKPPSIVSVSSGVSQDRSFGPRALEKGQTRAEEIAEQLGSMKDCSMLFPAIDGLPIQVLAPEPPVGDRKFDSHVSGHLQELLDRPKLSKIFQPMRVVRDVKVLERGYWLMEIIIADDQVVNRARNSPTKEATVQSLSDRFAGATAEERLARYWKAKTSGTSIDYDYGHEDEAVGKWTEAEFLTFWDQMSTFVQRGRAGWAVRMVRDDIERDLTNKDVPMRQLRIRIFTWGEVIAHIYLAIWLCSDKMAVRIPMKWVAGDGSTVVEMSGKKKFTGNLAPWARKGPAGEGGSWGVSNVV